MQAKYIAHGARQCDDRTKMIITLAMVGIQWKKSRKIGHVQSLGQGDFKGAIILEIPKFPQNTM